jgi:predicted DNA-binding protein
MSKTPDYTRKAINNYKEKFDIMQLRLPKGTRDRIKALTKESHNDFIVKAVIEKIESMES